jgi:ParB family chromosome partitioning protein
MSSEEAGMADDAARSRLGRGLASLIGDIGAESQSTDRASRSQRKVPIEHVRANPRNPRKLFSDAELNELSASIRERGIIQPIVVRARGADNFEIIAGERRWRAAQRANLHEVPIVVLDVSDGEALELAIIENVQRTDLNPLEEATGYQSLANEFNHSQDDIAKIVGKSRSHIANTLRLLKLPETVKAYINAGKLSAGHARALINHPDPEAVAREIVEKGLNVRQVEALGQEQAAASGKKIGTRARVSASKDADTLALETRLSDALGLVVGIDHRGKGGVLRVRYRSLDQLDEVIRRLESGPRGDAAVPRIRRP